MNSSQHLQNFLKSYKLTKFTLIKNSTGETALTVYRLKSLTGMKREIVEKYGYLGLTLFVAVPLPVTGAWTGSLMAFLMHLDRKKSMIFIFIGILIAGSIVLTVTYGIFGIIKMLPLYLITSTSIP